MTKQLEGNGLISFVRSASPSARTNVGDGFRVMFEVAPARSGQLCGWKPQPHWIARACLPRVGDGGNELQQLNEFGRDLGGDPSRSRAAPPQTQQRMTM